MRRRTGVLAAASVVAVTAGAAGAAFTVGASRPAAAESRPTQMVMPAVAEAFSAKIADRLSVASSSVKPISEAAVFPSAELAGANPAEARFARTAPGGASVYVMPSKEGFCLTSSFGVEAGCYTSTEVDASAVICAPGLPPDQLEVFGVAPDGVDTLEVQLADGTERSIRVVGNVFVYRAPRTDPLPLTVSWSNAAGVLERVDANVPGDAHKERCATPKASVEDVTTPGARKPDGPEPDPSDAPVLTTIP